MGNTGVVCMLPPPTWPKIMSCPMLLKAGCNNVVGQHFSWLSTILNNIAEPESAANQVSKNIFGYQE